MILSGEAAVEECLFEFCKDVIPSALDPQRVSQRPPSQPQPLPFHLDGVAVVRLLPLLTSLFCKEQTLHYNNMKLLNSALCCLLASSVSAFVAPSYSTSRVAIAQQQARVATPLFSETETAAEPAAEAPPSEYDTSIYVGNISFGEYGVVIHLMAICKHT